jgi:uncharacterized phage infection (PIP) family protein YhgE
MILLHLVEDKFAGKRPKAKPSASGTLVAPPLKSHVSLNPEIQEKRKTMKGHTKTYDEKVRAELQQAKSQLEEFEARSKAQDKQVATDLINELKRTHQKIEKEREKLETSALEEMDQEKAEIEAGLQKLRAGFAQLATKLKIEPRKRAS